MKTIRTLLSLCLTVSPVISGNLTAQDQCPANLIHFWKFDSEPAGKITDRIGTLDGEYQTSPGFIEGKLGSAASFNGSTNVSLPSNADFNWGNDASFTIEFWVRKTTSCPNTNISSNNVVIGRDDNVTTVHWWAGIACINPGKVDFTMISNDGSDFTLQSKMGVIDGEWHLVGITRNGSTNTTSIYLDGQLDTAAVYPFTGDFATNAPIDIGWLNTGQEYHFDGDLDELAVYNSALNQSAFMSHFNEGAGKAYCTVQSEPGTHAMTVNFTGMTSVVGKPFNMYLINHDTRERLDSSTITFDSAHFSVVFDSLQSQTGYDFDFWSDKNGNGSYDTPPVDESWRLENLKLSSDTTVNFVYNTDYTPIFDSGAVTDSSNYKVTLNFEGFSQEVDRNMTVYIRESQNNNIVDSIMVMPVDSSDFSVVFDSVSGTLGYNIDYYTDVNNDLMYTPPPADHAWRLALPAITGDTVITISYDTNYTDIFPGNDTTPGGEAFTITIDFKGFDAEMDKNLLLYLRDKGTGDFLDSSISYTIDSSDFTLVLDSVQSSKSYHIDFYTDVNGDSNYQAPPTDHAWRIIVENLNADTTITFQYDTNYTDINLVITGVDAVDSEPVFLAYPNPANNFVTVYYKQKANSLRIYNLTGALVYSRNVTDNEKYTRIDVTSLKPGMYILQVQTDSGNHELKLMKE